jgi:hypothetical protein
MGVSQNAWRCIECLGMGIDAYEIVMESGKCMKWYCEECEKALDAGRHQHRQQNPTQDQMLGMLAEILQRSKFIDQRLSVMEINLEGKADKIAVVELENRVSILEEKVSVIGEKGDLNGVGSVSSESYTQSQANNKTVTVDANIQEIQDKQAQKQFGIIQ